VDKYLEYLQGKICLSSKSGFDIADSDIHPMLFPHQRDIVKWAVSGGRRAIMLHRKARGSELSKTYFLDSLKYLEAAEVNANMPSLFDFEKTEESVRESEIFGHA
jgi:hypothetical protein